MLVSGTWVLVFKSVAKLGGTEWYQGKFKCHKFLLRDSDTVSFFFFLLLFFLSFFLFLFFFFLGPYLQWHMEVPRLGVKSAAGHSHSHNNEGSEPRLRPTPQLTATLDPHPTEGGQMEPAATWILV